LAQEKPKREGGWKMAIVSVSINEDECTGCALCETTCPDVFELADDVATVKADADFAANEEMIQQAADECPVEAILIE
jgi:ferredoxin